MSVLNLEASLIYPPRWIDRSWVHRGRLSQMEACRIFILSPVSVIHKSKTACCSRSLNTPGPPWRNNSFTKRNLFICCDLVLPVITSPMSLLVSDRQHSKKSNMLSLFSQFGPNKGIKNIQQTRQCMKGFVHV